MVYFVNAAVLSQNWQSVLEVKFSLWVSGIFTDNGNINMNAILREQRYHDILRVLLYDSKR